MTSKILRKYQTVLISLALVMVTFAAFEQVRYNDFVDYDDDMYVTKNEQIQKGLTVGNIVWAFTSGYSLNRHPLIWLFHMVDCQLYALNPNVHILTKVFYDC